MIPRAGHSVVGKRVSADGEAIGDYRRLLGALASRARNLGSRDPESAAQETLKRSLENPTARSAVEFYLRQEKPANAHTPEWPFDRLLAWLHGVLCYVVREGQNRASTRRELPIGAAGPDASGDRSNVSDPAPSQLDQLIQTETERIVADGLSALDHEYRRVLEMRVDGLKYAEIATRLGVNENTVATWVSRGMKQLAQYVRKRTEKCMRSPEGPGS